VTGTSCCKKVDKSFDTYYEVPDGGERMYDEVDEGQDFGEGRKHLRNQVITSKEYEMEKLQDGAWAMKETGDERVKDGMSNVETWDGATKKVNILKFPRNNKHECMAMGGYETCQIVGI